MFFKNIIKGKSTFLAGGKVVEKNSFSRLLHFNNIEWGKKTNPKRQKGNQKRFVGKSVTHLWYNLFLNFLVNRL